MVIGKALRDYLRTDAGILAILIKPKVYLRRAPQQTKAGAPFVILSIAGVQFPTLSTSSEVGSSYKVIARVQADSFSTDEDEVDRLSEAMSSAMRLQTTTIQGVAIHRSLQDDERDNYFSLQDGSDIGMHRITQDYKVTYAQPT